MKADNRKQSFLMWWLILFGIYLWFLPRFYQNAANQQQTAPSTSLPKPGAAPAGDSPRSQVERDPAILPPAVLDELLLDDPAWAAAEPRDQAVLVLERLKGLKDPEAAARYKLTAAYLYDQTGQAQEAAKVYAQVPTSIDRRAQSAKYPDEALARRQLRIAAHAALRASELYLATGEPRDHKLARRALDGLVTLLQRDTLHRVEVLEKQPDGSWRAAEDPYGHILQRIDAIAQGQWAYRLLDGLVKLCGGGRGGGYSVVLALFLLAIGLKAAMYPLSRKQYQSMQGMQALQPELQALQKRHKDNPQRLNEEMMRLYREHGVNPMAGCLPMFLQLPVFIGVYQGIRAYTYHFHKVDLLWVESLAGPDTALLVIYGVSMFATQMLMMKMQPTPSDPSQASMQKMMMYGMPLMFTVMMYQWRLPSAFYLYWMAFNVLSTGEQLWIRRKKPAAAPAVLPPQSGPPPEGPKPTAAGPRKAGRKSSSGGRRKRRGGKS